MPQRSEVLSGRDRAVVTAQLGRDPRGAMRVAWRCPCGEPGAVVTAPRLPDGVPFPTTYYLTCRRAVAGCSRLESTGLMREMNDRLAVDTDLRRRYEAAHRAYVADRTRIAEVAGIDVEPLGERSAGGMPKRVKCLHALLGHALAVGPGVNPLGDEVRERLGRFWDAGPCTPAEDETSVRHDHG